MGTNYESILTGYGVFLIVLSIIFPCITGVLASKKGKNVAFWVLLSFLIGLLAIIILAFSQDETKRKRSIPSNFYTVSSAISAKRMCMKCGNTLTGPVCDMCGFSGTESPSTRPIKSSTSQAIPIKKIEKYKCVECCQIIDTIQCPWCGARKTN